MSGAPLYDAQSDETELQPEAPERSLVEPEGVNAGSAATTGDADADVPSPGSTLGGGMPEQADAQIGAAGSAEDEQGTDAGDTGEFAGQPTEEPGYPSGQESGPSGQDSGSMD